MAAHESSLSLGFSRQEHWNELSFPSPSQILEEGFKKWERWKRKLLEVIMKHVKNNPLNLDSTHVVYNTRLMANHLEGPSIVDLFSGLLAVHRSFVFFFHECFSSFRLL